ncbi:DUF4129 domain-containing protein [Virgibacillus sp. W0181]|uniref:DUF4129 domain-containing protein n=1 Tax=Virgibacillus sp. W0181 TaxID=3391581 RepID=UPI003F466490
MNVLFRAFVVLFSEAIWIYFIIALFAGVEWDEAVYVHVMWWIVAGLSGFVINNLLAGKVSSTPVITINGFVLILIVIQNWRLTVPEGLWSFGIYLTIAVSFVFIRSVSFVYKKTTRQQLLHRFEGNVVLYAVFVFAFTVKDWDTPAFHFSFIVAIMMSLMGMILTLQSHEQEEGNLRVEVHKAGNSGTLFSVVGVLFSLIVIASSLLFLPSVRESLHTLGKSGLAGVKWLYEKGVTAISWLFGLFPETKGKGELPDPQPSPPVLPEEDSEELLFSLPLAWIVGIIAAIAIIAALWLLSRYLKRWQPKKAVNVERTFTFGGLGWKKIMEKIIFFIRRLQRKWKQKFSRYYFHNVYWYFHQVEKWGEKNGLKRLATETAKDYAGKMIHALANQEDKRVSGEKNEQLAAGLLKISNDYQAVYYGGERKSAEADYKLLLDQLREIRLK